MKEMDPWDAPANYKCPGASKHVHRHLLLLEPYIKGDVHVNIKTLNLRGIPIPHPSRLATSLNTVTAGTNVTSNRIIFLAQSGCKSFEG